jgi:hypothetical protein
MTRLGFLLLILCSAAGCGDGINRVPIEGLLTATGTTPVNRATLSFIPAEGTPGEGAIGRTDDEGKFTVISSRQSDAGIPPGKYRVRISRMVDNKTFEVLPEFAAEADYPNAIESIPPPYSGINSPLQAEISESGGELKLDIPKKLKGQK